MNLRRAPKSVCTRFGLAMMILLLATSLGGTVLGVLAIFFVPQAMNTTLGMWILNDAAIYLIAAPAFLLMMRTIPDGQESARPRMRMNPGRFLLLLMLCFGITYGIDFVVDIVRLPLDLLKENLFGDLFDTESALDSLSFAGILERLFFGCVVPAFGEEFLFRYMPRKKFKGAGDKMYIVLTAFCFALFHGNFNQSIYTFPIGLLLAWIYVQTDSIWYPVALHFCFNFVGMVVTPYIVSDTAVMVFRVCIIVFAIASVVLLAVNWRKIGLTMRAPEEPGWPFKPPKAVRKGAQWAYPYPVRGEGISLDMSAPVASGPVENAPPVPQPTAATAAVSRPTLRVSYTNLPGHDWRGYTNYFRGFDGDFARNTSVVNQPPIPVSAPPAAPQGAMAHVPASGYGVQSPHVPASPPYAMSGYIAATPHYGTPQPAYGYAPQVPMGYGMPYTAPVQGYAGWQGQPVPAYAFGTQPPYAPYLPAATPYPAYGYGMPVFTPPVPLKPQGAVSLAMGNVGMILFTVFSSLSILLTLLIM